MRLQLLVLLLCACGITAVLMAPRTGFVCLAQQMIHAGDAEYADWRCLHYAAVRGDLEAIVQLLDYGTPVDQRNDAGRTALAEAARDGELAAVRRLINRGANVDAADQAGFTPLHLAAQAQNPAVVRHLLGARASVNARNKWQQTPLWLASWQTRRGNSEVTHSLVANGADVNLADEKGYTPLHMAARAGRDAIVAYLLDEGARVDPRNQQSRTPLYLAAIGDNLHSARLLLRNGADPNARAGDWTPLRVALNDGHRDLADLLAAYGARGYERYAARARVEAGRRLLEDQRLDDAVAAFDEAIAMAPDNEQAYYYRGLAHMRQNASDRALDDFQEALARAPDHAGALERAGMVYAQRGQYEQAIAKLQQLVNQRPDYGRGYHLLAENLRSLGKVERAESGAAKACRLGYQAAC